MGRGRAASGVAARGVDSALGGAPFPAGFYERSTVRVARDLLGTILVHDTPEGTVAARIVETEAYCGPRDLACHARGGLRTARNEMLYGPPGRAYVYMIYGMHFCLNAVTRPEGVAEAVLVRAAAPLAGLPWIRDRRGQTVPERHLLRGPGNLCRGLAVDRGHDGLDLSSSPLRILAGEPVPDRRVGRTPRIGVAYAGVWADRRWRFLIAGDPAVSGPVFRGRPGR